MRDINHLYYIFVFIYSYFNWWFDQNSILSKVLRHFQSRWK